MNVLGIDFGRKKIGLSLGSTVTKFAEPYLVLRYTDTESVIAKIKKFVKSEEIGRIVVGISEGRSADEAQEFGDKIAKATSLDLVFQDETLTTFEAQKKSQVAGIKRKQRRDKEDAFAATLILQNYLDGFAI